MVRNKAVTVLLEQSTYNEADKHREIGKHIKETESQLFNRIILHGLKHADCNEGKLN